MDHAQMLVDGALLAKAMAARLAQVQALTRVHVANVLVQVGPSLKALPARHARQRPLLLPNQELNLGRQLHILRPVFREAARGSLRHFDASAFALTASGALAPSECNGVAVVRRTSLHFRQQILGAHQRHLMRAFEPRQPHRLMAHLRRHRLRDAMIAEEPREREIAVHHHTNQF
eukprot:CAMPEP_0185830402 /NCGR_PEP_ID=MMETSP1353-20130828/827_1 /TAXON_ID=1077150 /ORGANISM="Erythrolobus australicus, Strain CCMP3124" /LENGTH=174 /DNA_ID=CAMNT_0028528305 /DNA_START=491 /DNA_END=1015 /DNA_ORIENTATION=+